MSLPVPGVSGVTRRVLATCIRRSSRGRDLAMRLPFSRLAPWMGPVLGGSTEVTWRGARLLADPGEMEGYFRYFFPEGPDAEYDFLFTACRNAAVFFDIGANQGIYSLALARAYPHLQAVAFEPDPDLEAQIRRNLALNPEVCGRVHIESAAVAAVSGTLRFTRAQETNSGTGSICGAPTGSSIQVRAITLADFIARSGLEPDAIKIDVEGAEVDVLRGLPSSVTPRAMVVELHPRAFGDADRSRYQHEIVAALRSRPLRWRFLLEESRWADDLLPAAAWPARIHAFGTRRDDPAGAYDAPGPRGSAGPDGGG